MKGAVHIATAVVLLTTAAGAQVPNAVVPTPIGRGALYHPGPRGPLLGAGRVIAGLACSHGHERRVGAHLELFARGSVVLVPAGIGIAPPLHMHGLKASGACSYPVRTREPTGVIELVPGVPATLGEFFAVWGQPLGRRRLVGFRTFGVERVRAWVDGRVWRGDPRSIPLLRHSEIVLELGRFVPPHASYRFEKGL